MSDLITLKEQIKTEAVRLGFTHMGIAAATPVHHYDEYLAWIRDNCQGEMVYLSRPDSVAKRGDPGLVMEGCQQVISLAIPYAPPRMKGEISQPGKGRISAYAHTRDYHDIILEKLDQLESFIRKNAGIPVKLRSYVDTGPVLERSFAVQSGIGMTGKNGCLIVQGTGSYFFLAEILTDLTLPADAPYTRDLCGTCTRCIDACPTGCIIPDHTIDARRCISYLTIEYKGIIPDEQKGQIGEWIFGCDVCQMVCPHNTWTPEQNIPFGEPCLPEFMDLASIFNINEEDFTNQFGDTPISRIKRNGFVRNSAIVLGNQVNPDSLPTLRRALDRETDPGVLDACGWAICEIEKHRAEAHHEKGVE